MEEMMFRRAKPVSRHVATRMAASKSANSVLMSRKRTGGWPERISKCWRSGCGGRVVSMRCPGKGSRIRVGSSSFTCTSKSNSTHFHMECTKCGATF